MATGVIIFIAVLLGIVNGIVPADKNEAQDAIAQLALQIRDYATGIGIPGIVCQLYKQKHKLCGRDDNWRKLGENVTTIRGCCNIDVTVSNFGAGNYRLVYITEPYFEAKGMPTFYPMEEVLFTKTEEDANVPVFLVPFQGSPYGYTSYKGNAKKKNNC